MIERWWQRALAPIAGGGLGALFDLWIGGTRVLNPTEFTWLMKLDWRIHFLGWHLFRDEPWHWPPGRIESYYAPAGTAIGFTDSIPLLAFPFKLISVALPMPFQYIGLWLLTCFVLQGVFGVLLTRIWTQRVSLQLLGAALFVVMPILLIRVGHPSLCSHFLILWSLWLYLRRDLATASDILSETALGIVAGLLHPYLAVMVLGILGAIALRDRSVQALTGLAAASIAIVVGWWASGLFTISGAGNLASEGLGYYSTNILAPFTPSGWSALLPELPVATEGQLYEGFNYLGAGMLALVLIGSMIALFRMRSTQWRVVAPLLAVCIAFAIYSYSPRVTLGSALVFDWSTPSLERFALFRATGRFFWPLAYLTVTCAIGLIVAKTGRLAAVTLLSAALALQLIDFRTAHRERRVTSRSAEFFAWPTALPSPAWHQVLRNYDHIVLVPARQCGRAPIGFESAAYLAGLHGLTINSAEVARFDEMKRRTYCGRLEGEIATGAIDDRSLYILDAPHVAALRAVAGSRVVCGTLDAARVCVTTKSYVPWSSVARLN